MFNSSCLQFYQIVIKVDSVYEIRMPAEVRALLQQLNVVVSLGLEGIPLSCIGAVGYKQRLTLWMSVPPVFVIVWATLVYIMRATGQTCKAMGWTWNGRSVMKQEEYDRFEAMERMNFYSHVLPVALRTIFLACAHSDARTTDCLMPV